MTLRHIKYKLLSIFRYIRLITLICIFIWLSYSDLSDDNLIDDTYSYRHDKLYPYSFKDDVPMHTYSKHISIMPFFLHYNDSLDDDAFKQVVLDFDSSFICQYPELPNGCEVTCLASILKFLGINADKCFLVDNFLPMGEVGYTDPNIAFIGNPHDTYSFGALPNVLVQTANDFLQSINSPFKAFDVSGINKIENIKHFINDGFPIAVWTTLDYTKPKNFTYWCFDGNKVSWASNSHCVVVYGYSDEVLFISDPITGLKEVNAISFFDSFKSCHYYAFIIAYKAYLLK